MSRESTVRVGLVGYGIGKVYAAAVQNAPMYYPDLPNVELVGVATTSEASGEKAIAQFGFRWHTTEYKQLVESPEIDAVIVASPNYLHHQMALDVLWTGKALYIDKPLANTLAEARNIVRTARETGRDGQMSLVVRYCPGLQYARRLIQEGRLGRIYAFRASYFRGSYQDPARPLRWKASMKTSGGGVLADYLPHIVDLVNWLIGKPDRVCAISRTFVTERPREQGSNEMEPVETDDHIIVQAQTRSGVIGTYEAGRLTVGPINDMRLEIYGSEGSLRWSVEDLNSLYFSEKRMPEEERGWLRIPTMQRYPGAAIPGSDLQVGFMRLHIGSLSDFVRRTVEGMAYDPGLDAGLHVQEVLEAAAISAREGRWVDVAE